MLYKISEKDIKHKMDKCIISFNKKISKFRINNLNFDYIYNLHIDYYGKKTNLSKLINISIINNNSLKILCFDKNIKNKIRRVIDVSNLNLTTNISNNDIIINLPIITQDYRNKIINLLKNELEFFKISLRNIRKVFKNKIKILFINKVISKDENILFNNNLQLITNKYIKKLNFFFLNKKKDILIN